MLEFETIYVYSEDGLVRVDLDWIGEGIDGDYDENDSKDVPLLRYGVSRKFTKECENHEEFQDGEIGEWFDIEDSSYCTQLNATAPREQLIEAAQFILAHVEDNVKYFQRQKRLYEMLSWICIQDGQPYCEYGTFKV